MAQVLPFLTNFSSYELLPASPQVVRAGFLNDFRMTGSAPNISSKIWSWRRHQCHWRQSHLSSASQKIAIASRCVFKSQMETRNSYCAKVLPEVQGDEIWIFWEGIVWWIFVGKKSWQFFPRKIGLKLVTETSPHSSHTWGLKVLVQQLSTITYDCRHFATKVPLGKGPKSAHNCRRLCANCRKWP